MYEICKEEEYENKRAEFWKYHIKEWSKTELTQTAYCQEHNLRPGRFTYWKNRFKKQNIPVELVQVPQSQIPETFSHNPQNMLRLNIGMSFQVEIPDGFSESTLTKLLRVLKVN